jgi:FkbM family methyltransferase
MGQMMTANSTYAIEAEDILIQRLHRAFLHQGADEPGFYVDIGAYDPSRASNTRLLYEAGWHGINIEPNPDQIEAFRKARPRDVTLNRGVAAARGAKTYTRFTEPMLNGFLDPGWITRHVKGGYAVVDQIAVECLPARDLMAEHLPEGQAVDLLNIDVELGEADVLRSWDWDRHRAAIVAIELHGPIDELLRRRDAGLPVQAFDALTIAATTKRGG